MLSIPHLPFTRMRVSRLRLSAQDLAGSMLASASRTIDKVVARLQRKFPHLSRRILISTFVVLIGFFGSLAAFMGLKPVIEHSIGNPGPSAEQANVAPQRATPSATATTDPVANPAPVASQASPTPSVQPAQPVGSAPVASPPAAPAPVISSTPTTSVLEPGRGSAAPAPTTTTTTPTVSPTPTAPTPITTTPTTDPVQSTVGGVQQTLNTTTQPVTDPVLNTTTKLLN